VLGLGHNNLTEEETLMLATSQDVGLPGGTTIGTRIEYRGYVLLRETSSRYWLMQVGLASNVYSVAKTDVRYVRY
jgi:hypothetical protein